MARVFPGGSNTDNLAATISAYDSGPWTAFAWMTRVGGTGGSNGRIFHVGTGTSGQLMYWSAETNMHLEQGFSVSQQHVSENGVGSTSTYEFWVMGYDGSTSGPDDVGGTTHDQMLVYIGNLSTSMAQVDGENGQNNASGSRTTGLTALKIGNRDNGLNRCWNGKIFCVGMVPYMMDLDTAEQLRQGNMYVLLDFSAPIFLFGLEGSDLSSHSGFGPSLTLTDTGTTTDTDPLTLVWDAPGGPPYRETINLWTPVTHRRNQGVQLVYYQVQKKRLFGPHYGVSADGNITPTGLLVNQTQKLVSGGVTPTGALQADFINGNLVNFVDRVRDYVAVTHRRVNYAYYRSQPLPQQVYGPHYGVELSGSITPTGSLTTGTVTFKNLSGSITPTGDPGPSYISGGGHAIFGTLTAEFVWGVQDVQSPLRRALADRRPHIHAAFYYQKRNYDRPTGTTTNQAVDGTISTAGNLIKQTNKALDANITPAAILTNLTLKNLAGGVTPTGALTPEFVSGLQDVQQRIRANYRAATRAHLHSAFTSQFRPEISTGIETQQTVSGSITPTGNLIKQTNKLLGAGITPGGTLTNQTNKLLGGTITPAGSLTADFISGLQDTESRVRAQFAARRPYQHAAFRYQRRYYEFPKNNFLQDVAGTITPTGNLIKQTNKALDAGITPVGTDTNQTNKNLGGAITPTGSLQADFIWGVQDTQQRVRWVFEQARRAHLHASFSYQRHPQIPGVNSFAVSLDGTITPTGNLIKQTNKMLDGAITPTGALAADPIYQLNKGQDRREQQWQAALRKPHYALRFQREYYTALPNVYQISLGGTIGPVGDLIKLTQKTLTAGITPQGTVVKLTSKSFGGTCSSSGSITKQQGKYCVASILPVGSIRNMVAKALVANLTPVGVPIKLVFKRPSGVITESGNLIAVLITGSGVVILDPLEGNLATDGKLQSALAVCYLEGSLQQDGQLQSDVAVEWLEGNLESSGVISGH